MNLSHRSEAIWKRRRPASDIGQPLDHSIQFEATIEAIGELTQVATEMLSLKRMIGPMKGVFHVAQHGVDPCEFGLFNAGRSTAGGDTPVRTGLNDGPETGQPIRGHFRLWRQVLARPTINRSTAKALKRGHAHGQGAAIAATGHRRHKWGLAGSTTATLAASTLSTPEGIVDLNLAAQGLAVVALAHGLHQLVLDQPGRVVGDPKVARQGHRREAALALGQQKYGQKPCRQWQLGVREHRIGGQGGLMMASMALNQLPGFQSAVAVVFTLRAAEPARPPQLEKRLPACVFGSVVFKEFGQAHAFLELDCIPGHVVTHCFSGEYDGSTRPSQWLRNIRNQEHF